MGIREYFTQLYGFIWKVFLQRWRTPITTIFEVLLPFLFLLFMGIAYWAADDTYTPSATYYSAPPPTNFLLSMSFCRMPGSAYYNQLPASFANCATPTMCLALVGDGQSLCVNENGSFTGMLMILYHSNGNILTPPMDLLLALQAYATETLADTHLFVTYGVGRLALSHYGSLVIASDDEVLARDFMNYCSTQSLMCKMVLKTDRIFSTHDEAEDYAIEHPATVWAIVTLRGDSVDGTMEDSEFTISMNYSASANTNAPSTRKIFVQPADESGAAGYWKYTTSGFLTLQAMIHRYYLQRNSVDPSFTPSPLYLYANISKYLEDTGSLISPMPVGPVRRNAFLKQWVYYIPLIACMAALFPVARLTALIVEEKPTGIREAMLIMGLHPTCLFGGWYVTALLMDFVASLLAAMIMKVSFFGNINYGVLLALYFTFMQQNTAFGFLVSSVFSNPRLACWVAAFLIFAFSMPPYTLPPTATALQKIFMCLCPCFGYGDSFLNLVDYANYDVPFTWKNATGTYNIKVAIGMMWTSFAVMMVLAYYLDRVMPNCVGRPAHPLFFLQPLVRLLGGGRAPLPLVPMSHPEKTKYYHNRSPASSCEPDGDPKEEAKRNEWIEHRNDVVDPSDKSVTAVFDGLSKTFFCGSFIGGIYTFFTGLFREGDRVVALDDVSFAMKTGEVSVLLGVNGAGKSTIMGIATGMIVPDSGNAYICGYDAKRDLQKCRKNVGYCPQMDIVWENLTVEEHLSFYARLKGFGFCVQGTVDEALELLGLESKRKTKACDLSGGQRRRLCVAIALVGESSILFLDEPTAGMDVQGRRTIYEALNRARVNRSVLICTHLLDEADRIGDRVLLVDKGRLCAEGSTLYLKSQMSIGYVVTCVLSGDVKGGEEGAVMASLVDFVKEKGYEKHAAPREGEVQVVPEGCKLMGIARRGREVSFRFPLSLLSTSGQHLLAELEEHRDELRLHSISLGLTTLEDVFMTATGTKLMRAMMEDDNPFEGEVAQGTVSGVPTSTPELEAEEADDRHYRNENVFKDFFYHFRALFIKRVHFAKRDWVQFIFQVFVPVVFLLLSLLFNLIRDPQPRSLLLDMSLYKGVPESEVMVGSTISFDPYTYKALFMPIPDGALGHGYKTLSGFTYTEFGTNSSMTLSNLLLADLNAHELPRYFALCPSNLIISAGAPSMSYIILHNSSFEHSAPQALNAMFAFANYRLFGGKAKLITARNHPIRMGEYEKAGDSIEKRVLAGMFVILPFILLPCFIIGYVVREKECGVRHLQWLSGANTLAYWSSVYIFDFACYVGTCVIAFSMFAIFQRKEFIGRDAVGPSMVLFLFFGLSMIPFSYFLSFFFTSPFIAQTFVLVINFGFGFLWVTLESFLATGAYDFVRVVTYVVRTLPAVSFGEGLYVLAGSSISELTDSSKRLNLYRLLSIKNASSAFIGGMGTAYIYMGSVMVGSILALVIFELLRLKRKSLQDILHLCKKDVEAKNEEGGVADDMVRAEEERVNAVEHGPDEDCIALQHVSKRYHGMPYCAVNDVSFGVHQGEVMALLGLNGAGKSTTISILAGEESMSSGRVYMNHISVTSQQSRRFIGYCPQYDALLDNLSVVEHLWLFSRLRNVREQYIEPEVEMLISKLGLEPCRDRPAYALSGGNKRRLCLAIALVGRTTSVLLDEPTSGMDVAARAQTCAMIKELSANKSVMLTTHLLEEAEALAHRCTFIARGRIRSVGTTHELKTRFAPESVFSIHALFDDEVNFSDPEEEARTQAIVEKMVEHVTAVMKAGKGMEEEGHCEISAAHNNTVVLEVHGRLSEVCRALADLRDGSIEGVPQVSYASVSQPTLEDVLLCQ